MSEAREVTWVHGDSKIIFTESTPYMVLVRILGFELLNIIVDKHTVYSSVDELGRAVRKQLCGVNRDTFLESYSMAMTNHLLGAISLWVSTTHKRTIQA